MIDEIIDAIIKAICIWSVVWAVILGGKLAIKICDEALKQEEASAEKERGITLLASHEKKPMEVQAPIRCINCPCSGECKEGQWCKCFGCHKKDECDNEMKKRQEIDEVENNA